MVPHLGDCQMALHMQQLVLQEKNPQITQPQNHTTQSLYSNIARHGTLPKPHFWGRERQLIIYSRMLFHGERGESL